MKSAHSEELARYEINLRFNMAKVDLHIHSKYSDYPTEWFLQKIGAGESYSEPETLYQLAKERGMSFVTITDHNAFEGSFELAEKYQDAFTGVESTVYFPEDGCKFHLLIWNLTGKQFEDIQNIRKDIYQTRDYLVENRLPHSVAHATDILSQKLNLEHLEKLILLFDVFEVANGGRTKSSNKIWFNYLQSLKKNSIESLQKKYGIAPQHSNSWKKGYTGGSDDHAGLWVGKTYTMAAADNPKDFLSHIRGRKTLAKGRSQDFQGLVFSVYKIASEFSSTQGLSFIRSLPINAFSQLIFGKRKVSVIDRLTALVMKADIKKRYKRPIAEFIEGISHGKNKSIDTNLDLLYDKISDFVDEVFLDLVKTVQKSLTKGDIIGLISGLSSSLPAFFLIVPFFSSFIHMNNNRKLLFQLQDKLPEKSNKRILWFTDTLNDLNGVSITLKQLGWKFYANNIDIRIVASLLDNEITGDLPPNMLNLPAAYDFRLPYYEQYIMKVPSILRALKLLNDFEPDEIFISTPGPVGLLGVLMSRLFKIPVTGIYHSDFTLEFGEIDGDESIVEALESFTKWFYTLMDNIKVPTTAYIDILENRGFDRSRMSVFPRQIDNDTFRPRSTEECETSGIEIPDGFNLLFVGRVSKDKNLDFLTKVYREVRKHREDVNLIVTGEGPYKKTMKRMLGKDARVLFTGVLTYDTLPLLYSQVQALVFPSITDTFGMAVLEAQCCELPAIVSDKGGPMEIVIDKETGFVLEALNFDVWVKAILDLIELHDNYPEKFRLMRRNARKSALARYGWEVVLKGLTSQELQPKTSNLDH
ncbi:MAG: glycosyltransferase [Calditrichaeota bacterium]|nr:glycosyltransferase [Calditrichota bacterium]MBT7616160.1 glycosyltransferase [Calditrichota bacterium]MBT7790193.1 glycosyltransferase [Calditrichota bacterium]